MERREQLRTRRLQDIEKIPLHVLQLIGVTVLQHRSREFLVMTLIKKIIDDGYGTSFKFKRLVGSVPRQRYKFAPFDAGVTCAHSCA